MDESKKDHINDSTPSVHLTVGELKALVRAEVEKAVGQNGHQSKIPSEPVRSYFTVKEAADISRLGPSTIRLYIRKRELRACQVGSRVIIKRTDLEKFLESHAIEIISD